MQFLKGREALSCTKNQHARVAVYTEVFFGEEQIGHFLSTIFPQKGSVMEPAVFFDILRIAAAFFFAYDKIILSQMKQFVVKHFAIQGFMPAQNGFWIGGKIVYFFLTNKSDKERIFIDDNSSAAAKAFD